MIMAIILTSLYTDDAPHHHDMTASYTHHDMTASYTDDNDHHPDDCIVQRWSLSHGVPFILYFSNTKHNQQVSWEYWVGKIQVTKALPTRLNLFPPVSIKKIVIWGKFWHIYIDQIFWALLAIAQLVIFYNQVICQGVEFFNGFHMGSKVFDGQEERQLSWIWLSSSFQCSVFVAFHNYPSI